MATIALLSGALLSACSANMFNPSYDGVAGLRSVCAVAEGNANACYANVLQSQSLIVVHKLNANETRSMIWEGAGMSNGGLVRFNYHFD